MNLETINRYMKKVLQIAESALEKGELPIAAIVVCDNKIISKAHTKEREEKRRLVHAELLALEKADQIKPFLGKRSDYVLITNLEPCIMCYGASLNFGLGEIYYGLESKIDGYVSLLSDSAIKPLPGNTPKISGGILRVESIELFRKYIGKYSSGGMWNWTKQLLENLESKP